MFRTRNYAVALGTLSLLAVSGTLAYVLPDVMAYGQTAGVAFSEDTSESFSATTEQPEVTSREDLLSAMRKKIAGRKNIVAVAETKEPEVTTEEETPVPEEGAKEESGELRCTGYQTANIAWSSAGVKIEEVEGARLVYKEGTPTMVGSTSIPTRDTLAQLPLRTLPSSADNCIATDVVGISKSGALMRNTEVLAYSGFGASVLVGYALDGFPIYGGAHSGSVDKCGGATVGGQYRYFVGSDQETVINCFSASPIRL